MRVCASCGRENPDDADFCVCGEYLRWEPTNHVRAVSPAAGRRAALADQRKAVDAGDFAADEFATNQFAADESAADEFAASEPVEEAAE